MEPQIVPFSAKSFQIYSWQTAGWRKALKVFSNPSLCWYLHISHKKQAIRLWIFNIKVKFAKELKASKCLTIDTEKSLSSIDFVLLASGERWSRGIPHDAGRQQVWWGGRQEETILFMTMMTFIMFRQAGSVRKDRRGFAGNKETLPKALRTQALTALTSNCGLVGLVQYAWKAMFDLFW